MTTGQGDAFLIEAVQGGDPDAWRQIIDRYEGRLLSFARRRLAPGGEAEDLVQDTFLGLLRSLPNYDRERSLETYLFSILRHKLNDHFRKQKTGRRQSLDALSLDDSPQAWLSTETPSGRLMGDENVAGQLHALVKCLRQYVEQCSAMQRFQELMVVEMLVVLGMRNKEIASDLGLTETAVAGVKFRALEHLRQIAQTCRQSHDWGEVDLAATSSLARVWREEGVSCPKRSTLGRYLLGALDDEWSSYVEFHAEVVGCDRCQANLDDLRSEDEGEEDARRALREKCFASSVGFLSRKPDQ